MNDLALFDLCGEAKRCTLCRELKPLDEFHRSKKSRSGLKHYCIKCSQEHLNSWRAKNLEHCREYARKYRQDNPEYAERRRETERKKYWDNPEKARGDRLRYKYGITLDEYREMKRRQNGVCAICLKECKTGRDLAVDHDHLTGVVRELLCGHCNKGIGLFYDDPELLMKAIDYLRRHQQQPIEVQPEGGTA